MLKWSTVPRLRYFFTMSDVWEARITMTTKSKACGSLSLATFTEGRKYCALIRVQVGETRTTMTTGLKARGPQEKGL